MKIICFIQDIQAAGAERQLCGLAVELRAKGHDVEVWTYVNDMFYLDILQKGDVVFKCFEDNGNKLKRIPKFCKLFKQAKPDLVISYLETPSIIACAIKMMGCKFKLIVSERNTTQVLSKHEKVKFFMYKAADAIVPNSFSQGEFISKHYPKLAKKTTVITNFTDVDRFIPASNEIEGSETIRFLTLARVALQKNGLNYIRAIKKVIDAGHKIGVEWFGEKSMPEYHKECESLINELGIQDSFHFMPATKNSVEEYQKGNIFCLPSVYEGFPNVVCEAMSCGLPILCSRVCDNPYIVQQGKNGFLFDPNNVDDIAKKIISYLELGDEEKKALCKNNRDRIIELCSKKSMADKYETLIKKIFAK